MKKTLQRIVAIIVGAVFIYAGILKLRDPLRFASDINNYQMIPWSVGVRFAFYLPWLELLCGLALVFHRLFSGAVAITIALLLAFIGATAWARIHGIDVSCGCFGSAGTNLSLTWHLVILAVLLLASIYLWCTRARVPST
ncbi:MAG: MauE/DoxX family redox-associated membrane protein [Chthoniobacterales bacterium]